MGTVLLEQSAAIHELTAGLCVAEGLAPLASEQRLVGVADKDSRLMSVSDSLGHHHLHGVAVTIAFGVTLHASPFMCLAA